MLSDLLHDDIVVRTAGGRIVVSKSLNVIANGHLAQSQISKPSAFNLSIGLLLILLKLRIILSTAVIISRIYSVSEPANHGIYRRAQSLIPSQRLDVISSRILCVLRHLFQPSDGKLPWTKVATTTLLTSLLSISLSLANLRLYNPFLFTTSSTRVDTIFFLIYGFSEYLIRGHVCRNLSSFVIYLLLKPRTSAPSNIRILYLLAVLHHCSSISSIPSVGNVCTLSDESKTWNPSGSGDICLRVSCTAGSIVHLLFDVEVSALYRLRLMACSAL
eukprot:IDg14655t1